MQLYKRNRKFLNSLKGIFSLEKRIKNDDVTTNYKNLLLLFQVNLLDGKRNLNINIWLRQFRSSNEDIIQMILDGDHDDFGAEKLKGLMKIMPEMDEIEMLKSFDKDKTKLGNAEKFEIGTVKGDVRESRVPGKMSSLCQVSRC